MEKLPEWARKLITSFMKASLRMTFTTASEGSYTPMEITTSVTGLMGSGLDSENWWIRVAELTRANGSTVSSWESETTLFISFKND
jgi:hypothetical protein